MNATISLIEYLQIGKIFEIPNYQRGYIWGQKRAGSSKDSVSHMLETLWKGFENGTDIFIQGVTVSETQDRIIIIDGQQRTTFFYLLLKYLGYEGKFEIKYEIRTKSNDFLSSKYLLSDYSENIKEELQDIYFFKKTLRLINNQFVNPGFGDWTKEEIEKFTKYILEHVKFLYINIPKDKAKTVFTMMNGNKAIMKPEELIKAEVLRIASLNGDDFNSKDIIEQNAIEWDNNMLRSRYAREWDKWLQWWNREDVQKFFKVNNVMGLLIRTLLITEDKEAFKDPFSFEKFKKYFLQDVKPIEAKKTFDLLRRLQKKFEDAFNTPITYNKIGAILRVSPSRESRDAFISWYFGSERVPNASELDNYYKKSFIGLTHKQIIDNDQVALDNKFEELLITLNSNNLYLENAEEAFKLLLRLNIDEDNLQEDGRGRKFDFSIWDRKDSRGRSLEHIYPKSKVWHREQINGKDLIFTGDNKEIGEEETHLSDFIERDSCFFISDNGEEIIASEHSIGNLVLLYKDDNSSFNDSNFSQKKELFFKVPHKEGSKKVKEIFKSRHLLHTIYKFAQAHWKGEDIAKNKYHTLKEFRQYYEK